MKSKPTKHSGYVALMGRTNVGKSTFLNTIMDSKISIVSDKPQTTRRQILGIKTTEKGQIIFFDSPGIHKPYFKLNEKMMKDVHNSLLDTDIILYFVTIDDQNKDEFTINMIEGLKKTTFLIINKIDKYNKAKVLKKIDFYQKLFDWDEIVPISALNGDNVDHLENLIFQYLPESDYFFPPEEFTQQSERFYVAELIREKLLNFTRNELPFTTTVKVQEITEREKVFYIRAEIFVESHSQKKIVVGKQGSLIKQIGETARVDLEDYFDMKVFLDLFVKVVPNWRNSSQVLKELFE
jgi:GTP-binding protein Era